MKAKIIFLLTLFFLQKVFCRNIILSEKFANNVVCTNLNQKKLTDSWNYENTMELKAIMTLWQYTGKGQYFQFVQNVANNFLLDSGNTIKTYKADDFNLDNVLGGNVFLSLYQVTENRNYFNAVQCLYQQLKLQPRTSDGGFWHKARYPQQMWLDGMYMANPFYTRYALAFHQTENFNDIARQFLLITHKTRNKINGLLYHAWDADCKEQWSNPATGTSPNFWGRAMGWYGMALVDVLENFPTNNVYYDSLKVLLNDFVKAISAVQDVKTGTWWNILNYANQNGNYIKSSASCMFTYTIAKALRFKWIDEKYKTVINKAYEGIIHNFVIEKNDFIFLTNTVKVSGLGGNPYRDGSYKYYCSEPVVTNDSKGISAFILMDIEMALYKHSDKGKGITVVLDNYFNAEKKGDITGTLVPYHYKWNEMNNGGFSTLQFLFQKYGVTTTQLANMPSKNNLPLNSIYLIVDADDSSDNPNPNFMNVSTANFLKNWVYKGGVLCVLHNDKGNAEFKHMNLLLSQFGIRVNEDSYQHFSANQFMEGVINVPKNNEVLPNTQLIYQKGICSISTKNPAKAILKKNGVVVMALTKYGKGTVFVTGDPWLYNEFIDGRKLPEQFNNYVAAEDWIQWLIQQVKNGKS